MSNKEIQLYLDKQEIPYRNVGDIIEIDPAELTTAQMEYIDKLVPDEDE